MKNLHITKSYNTTREKKARENFPTFPIILVGNIPLKSFVFPKDDSTPPLTLCSYKGTVCRREAKLPAEALQNML